MRYIPARNHGGPTNLPIHRIVIHGTVTPCRLGEAIVVAKMFERTSRDASTQKVHDPGESIRCVPDNVVAYGAPPNTGSLHHELCDPQTGPGSRWQDAAHQAMLRLAAADVANDCRTYGIPVVKLSSKDLLAGKRGICGHVDVSNAWHQTTHVDPGPDFPWKQFLGLVKAALKTPPASQPGGDDTDMPTVIAGSIHDVQALTPGVWKVLVTNTVSGRPSPSMAVGPARVEGTITLALDHIPAGPVTVNAYLAALKDGAMQVVDTAGTAKYDGTDQLQFHVSKTIPAGQYLRLRIYAQEAAAVTYVRHDFSTWKA